MNMESNSGAQENAGGNGYHAPKDISEVLDRGGSVADIERVFDTLPEFMPQAGELESRESTPQEEPKKMDRIRVIQASTVEPEQVEWLWRGRLPVGKIVTFDGDPGLGKSTVLLDIAARVSRGASLPDGEFLGRPRSVLILSAEDGVADTIVPRLNAARADLERVFVIDVIEEARGTKRPPSLPDDIAHIREVILENEAALLIVDPMMAYLGGSVDSYKDHDVRRVMHRLKELAEECRVTTIVCRHLTKGGSSNPIYRGGGSIGIIGAARIGMVVAPEPGPPVPRSTTEEVSPRRIIAVAKTNLGACPPALAYRIESDPVYNCARVAWEGTTGHSAHDLFSVPAEPADGRDALSEAVEFLRDALGYGDRPGKGIEQEARDAGISVATLRRAKEQLGVRSRKVGQPGEKGEWLWCLPERSQTSSEDIEASPTLPGSAGGGRSASEAVHLGAFEDAQAPSLRSGMSIFEEDEHLRENTQNSRKSSEGGANDESLNSGKFPEDAHGPSKMLIESENHRGDEHLRRVEHLRQAASMPQESPGGPEVPDDSEGVQESRDAQAADREAFLDALQREERARAARNWYTPRPDDHDGEEEYEEGEL